MQQRENSEGGWCHGNPLFCATPPSTSARPATEILFLKKGGGGGERVPSFSFTNNRNNLFSFCLLCHVKVVFLNYPPLDLLPKGGQQNVSSCLSKRVLCTQKQDLHRRVCVRCLIRTKENPSPCLDLESCPRSLPSEAFDRVVSVVWSRRRVKAGRVVKFKKGKKNNNNNNKNTPSSDSNAGCCVCDYAYRS